MAFVIISATYSCEEDLIVYDADNGQTGLSFARSSTSVSICDSTIDVVVESTTKSSSDRTYNIVVNAGSTADPSEYTVGSTVTIPAGAFIGSTEASIDFAQLPDDTQRSLILDLVPANGAVISARGSISINYESVCVLNEVVVDLQFDQYAEEAAYIISNAAGAIVDASYNAAGNIAFGTFAGLTSFSKTLCLPDGDYTVTFFDSYGDGNDANSNGSYGLIGVTCEGSAQLINRVRAGNFGANGSVLGTAPISLTFSLGN